MRHVTCNGEGVRRLLRKELIVERLYRFLFLGLFILGFVGAVTSAGANKENLIEGSLIQDMQLVNEANSINSGRWNIDETAHNGLDAETLNQVEKLLTADETVKTVSK